MGENNKFVVVDVSGHTPYELEETLINLHSSGYETYLKSNISWYQGKGDDGIIVFKLKEE